MSKIKIYVDGLSQPARALMLFVRSAGIPFEEHKLSIMEREHKTDEYKKVNPVQKIPAIDHDGFCLSECAAILRYLTRTFPVASHWYPTNDSKTIAQVDEYMEWQHLNMRLHGSRYFASVVFPAMLGLRETSPALQEKMKRVMEQNLDAVQNVFLSRGKFIAGDSLTIADCMAVGELEQPRLANYDVRNTRPIIGEYLERVRKELNPHYDQVHETLNHFQQLRAEAMKE